jgi:antitoxin HicB
MSNRHHGSSLDEFLEDEGHFEEAEALAIKEVLVWQIEAREKQVADRLGVKDAP